MHDAGAAVVAAQLLAFYKEPVRYRPKLTHGREPFQGGLMVLRFAQGKFPNAIIRDLSPPERERLREAAMFFIRQVCFWDGASHYQLLCVAPDARRDAIKEHYHALMALIHPDRAEAQTHWPSDAAQRANHAYAVLCDEEQRRDYDAGLRKSPSGPASLEESVMQPPHTAAVHVPMKGRGAAALIRYRKPALVVLAAVATLFFLQVWWASDVPREHAVLPSAAPFDVSTRWMRDVLSSDRPRYLAPGEAARASASRSSESDDLPIFTPLWRALSTRASDRKPVQKAQASPPATNAPATSPAAVLPAVMLKPADSLNMAAPPPPAETKRQSQASMSPPPAVQQPAPAELVQALPERQSGDEGISSDEMEMLVARVVTYYEAGDLDRLLGLYDAVSVGLWEALRLRHDFQEFFRTTKGRRLRLTKVSWDTSGQHARAQGEAVLVAEYTDEPGKIERSVKLELEATARNGQPRITRLSLFPHGG